MNTGENSSIVTGNYFHRYLHYASAILVKYNGNEPFHLYLKKYFSANKKHGAKDRKQITSLCYNFFRVGFGISSSVDIAEKLLLAIFLVEKKPSSLLGMLKPEWNKKIHFNISDKFKIVSHIFDAEKIFPFQNELSEEINFHEFNSSFLIQPKLFIRIRPGFKNMAINKLRSANIAFEELNENCFAFSNNEKVSDVICIDKEAVIQDYNSQRVSEFFKPVIENWQLSNANSTLKIWDCCAASGGKSILANDIFKNIELTVTDTRKNILENLKARFSKAGIKNYHSFVADLSTPDPIKGSFNLIIADVPCSGSGTWARTPEQLNFFPKKNIEKYGLLQQKIIQNVGKFLTSDGYLLYITCSVFKRENEENIEFIQQDLKLVLLESKYLKGYEMQADTLFAALFRK